MLEYYQTKKLRIWNSEGLLKKSEKIGFVLPQMHLYFEGTKLSIFLLIMLI